MSKILSCGIMICDTRVMKIRASIVFGQYSVIHVGGLNALVVGRQHSVGSLKNREREKQ